MIPCAHTYRPAEQPDYERCTLCGTYHSTAALAPEAIYADGYWDRRGHSTLREQVYNVDTHEECGRTKNAYVLNLIETGGRTAALEIGCAPGTLLRRLREDVGFQRVFGVDVDAAYQEEIAEISGGADLTFGYFPQATAEWKPASLDLVVGCDIFEHAHDPAAFLRECARLLDRRGQLLLMLPIVGQDVPPARFFAADEHVYLHSAAHLMMLLDWAGFEEIRFGQWTAGHETVTARLA